MKFKDKQKTLYRRQQNLRQNPTKAEKHIYNLLSSSDHKYVFQKGFISKGQYCIVDFYFPKPLKICLEIDGEYHLSEKQQRRDEDRTQYLEQIRGFKVVRLTNKQALKIDSVDELISILKNIKRGQTNG